MRPDGHMDAAHRSPAGAREPRHSRTVQVPSPPPSMTVHYRAPPSTPHVQTGVGTNEPVNPARGRMLRVGPRKAGAQRRALGWGGAAVGPAVRLFSRALSLTHPPTHTHARPPARPPARPRALPAARRAQDTHAPTKREGRSSSGTKLKPARYQWRQHIAPAHAPPPCSRYSFLLPRRARDKAPADSRIAQPDSERARPCIASSSGGPCVLCRRVTTVCHDATQDGPPTRGAGSQQKPYRTAEETRTPGTPARPPAVTLSLTPPSHIVAVSR